MRHTPTLSSLPGTLLAAGLMGRLVRVDMCSLLSSCGSRCGLGFVEDYVLLILSLSKSYHFPHFLPNGKIELYRSAFFFFLSFFLFIMDIFRHAQKWRDPRVPSPSYIIYQLRSTQFHLHLHLPACIVYRKSKTLCQFNWDHFGRLRHCWW